VFGSTFASAKALLSGPNVFQTVKNMFGFHFVKAIQWVKLDSS